MTDEGVHEIQLNGKQLVFLFMTGTVAAVVVFLCGVMVGRGIQAPRVAPPIEASTDSGGDPTASARPAVAAPSGSSGVTGGSSAPDEVLTYADRLGEQTPPPEELQEPAIDPTRPAAKAKAPTPPAEKPTRSESRPAPPAKNDKASPATPARVAPPAPAVAAAATPAPAPAAAAEPAGKGFVVQVAAVRERSEADAIARRLAAKGYPSFVSTGAPHVFRVRVGKYADRHQADTVASRLKREEQFKPWITR